MQLSARPSDESPWDLTGLPAIAVERAKSGIKSTSIENPAVDLADADGIWEGTISSASGQPVSPQRAMRLAAFWSAVNLIAGDVAKLPLEVFVRDGKDREADTLHPAYRLVRWAPNERQTAFEFWSDFVGHLLVWRNAWAWIERDRAGRPLQLLPLLPDRTEYMRIDNREWVVTEVGGKLIPLDPYDVLHVRGLSFDGRTGLELMEYARDVIGKSLARQNFQSKFFRRGGRVGGILELPASMPKPIKDKTEEGFRKTYETEDGPFQTVVLRDSAKFHSAQSSFRESQMLESGQEDIREIARLFNIPPHKLGDTVSRPNANLEQENRSYYDSTLGPWLANIKQALWRQLLTERCQADGCHFFDYNVGALAWADLQTVATIGGAGIQSGWITRAEVRRWFNLPFIPGSDALLVPVNMQLADQASGGGTNPPGDPPADPPSDPPADPPAEPPARSCRCCSAEWMDSAPRSAPRIELPAPTPPPAIDAALDLMISDARARFVNRLRNDAARRCNNAEQWSAWLDGTGERTMADHVAVGRSMFGPAVAAAAAVGRDLGDPAAELVQQFRAAARAGLQTADSIQSLLSSATQPPETSP